MSHFLTDDQKAIQQVAREFAQTEVEPRANEMDATDELPEDLIGRVAELGFFGLAIPEEFGGLEAGMTTTCLVLEEIGKASPALAGLLSVQIALVPVSIAAAGTQAQKEKYLTAAARGEGVFALAHTEPVGGANVPAHQTRLTADGDGYLLNGLKVFCTQGTASVYMVGAHTSMGEYRGYGEVLVERGMAGFEVGKYEEKLGWRGSRTGTLLFHDVQIPPENILGGLLSGIKDIGLGRLTGNLGHAAGALGCVEGMFDKTVDYAKNRSTATGMLADYQPLAYWLADAWVRIEACRSLLYTTTRMFDEGTIDDNMAMACKVHVCEESFEICHRLLQMWGGHGVMTEVGVNRYFRDARTNTIAEGSSETLLAQIAGTILA